MKTGSAPKYVLDTNIWLDWLVFSHDLMPELKAAQSSHHIDIIYTINMLEELADVLGRPHFQLTAHEQQSKLEQMQNIGRLVEQRAPFTKIRCSDKDDQIFIDTALAYNADWLLSKDKHLLALRQRAFKQGVRISVLEQWWVNYAEREKCESLLFSV